VANYSDDEYNEALNWELIRQSGTIFKQGILSGPAITSGGLTNAGEIKIDLSAIDKAERLILSISIPGTSYHNTYPIWVYPLAWNVEETSDILVTDKIEKHALAHLQDRGKVLLMPSDEYVQGNSYPGLFPPDFWNYGMFKGISEWANKPVSPGTLGLMTDPNHPIFNDFPTDFHTNWQWFSIIKESNALILDKTSNGYMPVVQVIDNLERNHKLGLIFEFRAGNGKMLVCMSRLNRIMDRPEAAQLYRSIINYMDSPEFNPDYTLSNEEVEGLLTKR
jgi:hypothetical protein